MCQNFPPPPSKICLVISADFFVILGGNASLHTDRHTDIILLLYDNNLFCKGLILYLKTNLFRKSTFKKDQQMLSAQMLSGIPEVDLGIEAKIQNIERTEKAKRQLLEEARRGNKNGEDKSQSNQYVQHDRCLIGMDLLLLGCYTRFSCSLIK